MATIPAGTVATFTTDRHPLAITEDGWDWTTYPSCEGTGVVEGYYPSTDTYELLVSEGAPTPLYVKVPAAAVTPAN